MNRVLRISLVAGTAVAALFFICLLSSGSAMALGPGQPVVELQDNSGNGLTVPTQFTGQAISGTDTVTKQAYKFQRQRVGRYFSYAVGNLQPSTTYTVELSFVEHYFTSSGKRIFNVYIQGSPKLSKLDIYAAAPGANRAYQRTFSAVTNSQGLLTVKLRSDESGCKDNAAISTIRIFKAGVNAVEISAFESRLNSGAPIRFAGGSGQVAFETALGRLGSRASLNLVPQRLAARYSSLGDGTGDLADMVLALKDGATIRALPLTDRYPVWENLTETLSMTSQTFTCSSTATTLEQTVTFRAPFYPGNENASGAPFFYVDVKVKNNGIAPVSPQFILARPHKRTFAQSPPSEYSDADATGMTWGNIYNYYDESYNLFKVRSATEALALPLAEAADVDFRGSAELEFSDFTADTLWEFGSPSGYPTTYSDYKKPTFSFYPRGYSGAVWSPAVPLLPGEEVEKHFVLAGHVPGYVFGASNSAYSDSTFKFRYTQEWSTVNEVAGYAVTNRDAGDDLKAKSDFFDSTISSDSYLKLPAAYGSDVKNLIAYSFQCYLINTWWMHSDMNRDWFSVWEGSTCRYHGTVDVEYNHAWFYFSYWPDLLKTVMDEWTLYLKTAQQGTYLSHDMGAVDYAAGQSYPYNMAVEENANFILLLYKYWKTTGNLAYVQQRFGLVRQFVDFIINCDDNANGIPDQYTQNTIDQGSLAIQRGKDQAYLGVKCLAAHQAARQMALALPSPDANYAAKCGGQVELINQTLEYDLWRSDHYAVCIDQDMAAEDADAYSIYPGNGLLYLLSGGRTPGFTTTNTDYLKTDLAESTLKTLKMYGCSHTSYDPYTEWVSQNLWRDEVASYLRVNLNGANPLAMSARYWDLEIYFATAMNGCWWDSLEYPGGSGGGPSVDSGMRPPVFPGGASRDGSGRTGEGSTYTQTLGYYPRGAASLGLIDAVAGLTLDAGAGKLYYKPSAWPVRVPVLSRADWEAADPAARVPTLYFPSSAAAPAITNPALLPSTVADRRMRDLTGVGADGHAISPNGDAVNEHATVTYTLPVGAKVTPSIWKGAEKVRSYAQSSKTTGSHQFEWDGKEDGGTAAPDGIYTARMDSAANNTAYEVRPAGTPVYVNSSIPDLSTEWYLAEGFTGHNETGGEFEEYVLIQNPDPQPAAVHATFMLDGSGTVTRDYTVPASSRFTITVDDILPDAEVSTYLLSDRPVAAERAMYFNGRRAGHDSIGVSRPSDTWYLAEGYTAEDFDEYVLVQNPGDADAHLTATFMTAGTGNEVRDYTVGPHSRFTIHVDDIVPADSVSTQIESDRPVVVERAQYLNYMKAGTCSIGAVSTSDTWYLAEGYTDQGFEEWVLIQNPADSFNNVTVTFMEPDGTNTVKQYVVPPASRFTILVDAYLPATEVSVKVRSEHPVLVERAMYWNDRSDGHDCIGTPTPDSTWFLAEGYTAQGFETFVLVQNPGDEVRNVTFTYMEPNGTNTVKTAEVQPRSRFSVNVHDFLPDREMSVKVTADGPVIVERAIYFENRSGGTDSLGVRGY
ncbi:MAG: DUF4965 domain-containing protein [Actinobacteria bacterium]|nr:DUF4965 domain-containing protein [Actinomycetota bacterium]